MSGYVDQPVTVAIAEGYEDWPGQAAHLWTCTTCGALTMNPELHSNWHNTLEARS